LFLYTAQLHIEGADLIQYGEAIPCLQSCPNLTEGMIAKGRPANKRLKSSVETSSKKSNNNLGKENANRKEYICGKCKEIGHNSKTCKK